MQLQITNCLQCPFIRTDPELDVYCRHPNFDPERPPYMEVVNNTPVVPGWCPLVTEKVEIILKNYLVEEKKSLS